jgi:hypothetical protein
MVLGQRKHNCSVAEFKLYEWRKCRSYTVSMILVELLGIKKRVFEVKINEIVTDRTNILETCLVV